MDWGVYTRKLLSGIFHIAVKLFHVARCISQTIPPYYSLFFLSLPLSRYLSFFLSLSIPVPPALSSLKHDQGDGACGASGLLLCWRGNWQHARLPSQSY